MKKIIFGGFMMLSGILGIAILMAGAMTQTMYINDTLSIFWTLSIYGLMPTFYVFTVIAIIGLTFGCWGLFDKKN